MIFARHDFTKNFFSAVGYQDAMMENLIIIDEIARLIVDDKRSIVEQLRKAGNNVRYKDNNDIIKAYLVREIESGNADIIKFLSGRIALHNVDESNLKQIIKEIHADGDKTAVGQFLSDIAKDKQVQENVSTLISKGIEKVFSKNNTAKTSNEALLAERLKANEMNQAIQAQKKFSWIKLIVIISAISLAGYAIYYFVKKNKQAPAPMPGPVSMPNYTPINQ